MTYIAEQLYFKNEKLRDFHVYQFNSGLKPKFLVISPSTLHTWTFYNRYVVRLQKG